MNYQNTYYPFHQNIRILKGFFAKPLTLICGIVSGIAALFETVKFNSGSGGTNISVSAGAGSSLSILLCIALIFLFVKSRSNDPMPFGGMVTLIKVYAVIGIVAASIAVLALTGFTVSKDRMIPTMLRYKTHVDKESMYNTPPCINIFGVKETLKWVKAMGGVEAMEKLAIERADMLYAELESSKMFRPVVKEGSRSRMNIPFLLREGYESLEKEFLDFAKSKNIVGIKGHRSVGGFRASTYNACTIEDVKALVAAMKEFEAKHI